MSRELQNKRLNPQQRKLAEDHVEFAAMLAAKYCRERSISRDRDEIASAANLGLIDAAYSFCEARGVGFKTFARRRILGAIVDAFRQRNGRIVEGQSNETTLAKELRRSVRSLDDVVSRNKDGTELTRGETIPVVDTSQKQIDDADTVRMLMRMVPPRERFAYRMYHGHGHSMRDIAKMAGRVESGIWHQIRRAQAVIDVEVHDVV